MSTVNERLRDLVVRRAAQLERYKGALVDQLAEVIEAANQRAIRRVKTRLRQGQGQRGLFLELAEFLRSDYDKLRAALQSEIAGLMGDEARFIRQAMVEAIPLQLRVNDGAGSKRMAARLIIRGLTLGEHVSMLGANHLALYKSAIRQGVGEGAPLSRIIGALAVPDGPLKRARNAVEALARVAVAAGSSMARQEVYQRNGRLIRGVLYLAVLDSRVSPVCASLDGQIFPVETGPRPPAHQGCRSTTMPVIVAAGDVARRVGPAVRASMNGEPPGRVTFPEWLRSQPFEVQVEVLGRAKAQLFSAGQAIERFTDADLGPLTLAKLRAQEPEFWLRAKL